MKFKTLTAKNGGQLEKEFSEWMQETIEIDKISIHNDQRGFLVMAIFYNEDSTIDLPEDVPVVVEIEAENLLVEEVLCPCCHSLTRPTTVQKGRYKGRSKCTKCEKTFEAEEAQPDGPELGTDSNNVTVEPPKIGEVTNG